MLWLLSKRLQNLLCFWNQLTVYSYCYAQGSERLDPWADPSKQTNTGRNDSPRAFNATGEENCGRSSGLESWNALESQGKTRGGYEEKNINYSNSYCTGAKNVSAPNAGPGEAL